MMRLVSVFLLFLSLSQAHGAPENIFFEVLSEQDSLVSFGRGRRSELSPHSIQALVWNIKKGSMKNFGTEFDRYARSKELFILQEVYRDDAFNALLHKIRADWNFGISFLYKREGDTPTGTMVGSTHKASNSLVKHSPDQEPITDTPKSVTFSRYSLRGRRAELMVVSVHGINFETTGAFRRQMDQILMELKGFSGPIVLAGDFNTWNSSRMKTLQDLTRALELKEVRFENGEARKKFNGNILDHAFTRGVVVKSARVLTESKGSDHLPMTIDFRIPP